MRQLTFLLVASTTLGFAGGQGASAADLPARMPVKAPMAAPVVPATWTGCYLGGNIGWGRAKKQFYRTASPPDGANDGFHTADGFVGGGQIGCDYQFAGSWVIGVQGMIDWTDLDGEHDALLTTRHEATRVSWFATATARLGVTLTPNVLAYVKGGAAWVRDEHTQTTSGGIFLSSAKLTRSGWTVGGGLEWMLAPNWSIFVEYDFMDFGTKRIHFTPGIFMPDIDQRLQTVLVGLNYRFTNWR